MIDVNPNVSKQGTDFDLALSARIEKCCLSVSIYDMDINAKLDQTLDEVCFTIPCCIEKASLAQSVCQAELTSLTCEPLHHFDRLLLVSYLSSIKVSVLLELSSYLILDI